MSSSQMPKGVEHLLIPVGLGKFKKMSSSQMPKGVEHINRTAQFAGADDVFITDAERR